MALQTKSGKAFEYALAVELTEKISNGQQVKLEQNSQFHTAKRSFDSFPQTKQDNYRKAAHVAIDYITKLEPRLENPLSNDGITIVIQSDQKGSSGDIRDIVAIRSKHGWEVGFSAKNNHMAVKHSRLSDKIDFGKEWFGIPCSSEYMSDIRKIFGELRDLINENKKNEHILLWSDLPKKQDVYNKVLNLFQKELTRIIASNSNSPEFLLKYLIGKEDFYKIMNFKNRTTIQAFNLYNTLNQSSGSIHPVKKIQKLKLPTKIDAYERKRGTTLEVRFDGGWQLSLRIHNASSRVEPSLKFDIQLTGIPSSLSGHDEF